MWSYFEDLVIKKIVVQFKFNFDAQFNSYRFFVLDLHACGDVMMVVLSCMHAHNCFPLLCVVYMYERYITGLMSNQVIVGGY